MAPPARCSPPGASAQADPPSLRPSRGVRPDPTGPTRRASGRRSAHLKCFSPRRIDTCNSTLSVETFGWGRCRRRDHWICANGLSKQAEVRSDRRPVVLPSPGSGDHADPACGGDRQSRAGSSRRAQAAPARAPCRRAGRHGRNRSRHDAGDIQAELRRRFDVAAGRSTLHRKLRRLGRRLKQRRRGRPSRMARTAPRSAAAGGPGNAAWIPRAACSSTRPPRPPT
jgi:hypothetical protein